MIFIKLILTTQKNQVGIVRCFTDWEIKHAVMDIVRTEATMMVNDAGQRLSGIEGSKRNARNDRVYIEARRCEAIGCDPEHEVSIGFPAVVVDDFEHPQLAYAMLVVEWIVRLANFVQPPKETPAQ